MSVNEKNAGNNLKAFCEKSKSYFEGILCENRRWRSGEKVPLDEWVILVEVDDMNENSLLSTSADCSLLSNLDQSCSFVENRKEGISSQKLQIEELGKQLQDAKNVLVKRELNAALEQINCNLQNIEKCKKSLDEKVNEMDLELKEKGSNEILLKNKIIDLEGNVSSLNLKCSEYIMQLESLSEELKKSNLSVLEKAKEVELLDKENTEIKTNYREELLNVRKQREFIEVSYNIKLDNLLKENKTLQKNMEKDIFMKKNLEARFNDLLKKIQEIDEKNSELFAEIEHNADEKLKIKEALNLSLSQEQKLKENNLDMSKQIQSFDDKIKNMQLALIDKTNNEILLKNKINDLEGKAKHLNEVYRMLYPDLNLK